jgi:hypothetical protein
MKIHQATVLASMPKKETPCGVGTGGNTFDGAIVAGIRVVRVGIGETIVGLNVQKLGTTVPLATIGVGDTVVMFAVGARLGPILLDSFVEQLRDPKALPLIERQPSPGKTATLLLFLRVVLWTVTPSTKPA